MDRKTVATIPLFAGTPRRRRKLVARWADEVHVADGETLVEAGRRAHEFCVIVSGSAEVRSNGHRSALGPGDFFGAAGLLSPAGKHAETVVTTSDTHLVVMARREFASMMWRLPAVAERIRRQAATRTDARDRGSMSDLTCVVVGGERAYSGAQGFDYFEGISAETAGARGLCMRRLQIPPGGSARPHLHEHHETAIYVFRGLAEMRYGEGLSEQLEVRAGQFLFIPAGMPHQPYNPSDRDPCIAVLARTDPNEQESVVLLDERGRLTRSHSRRAT
jgi:uncharacterized RmlC-like cupin family protein